MGAEFGVCEKRGRMQRKKLFAVFGRASCRGAGIDLHVFVRKSTHESRAQAREIFVVGALGKILNCPSTSLREGSQKRRSAECAEETKVSKATSPRESHVSGDEWGVRSMVCRV